MYIQTSLFTRKKLKELGSDLLLHSAFSPALAASDYHLFRSLQNSLSKKLSNDEAIKSHWDKFIAKKARSSVNNRIMNLPQRWQKVIAQKGKYIID